MHCGAELDGREATWQDFIRDLEESANCRCALTERIAGVAAEQVYWETPALTRAKNNTKFEFVTISASLHRSADPSAFRSHFAGDTMTTTFKSLGGDATLIVPELIEGADLSSYNYLLSFLRNGNEEQIHELWMAVSRGIQKRISDRAVWLSTSGGGVPWLHFRLDDTPKYYSHDAYR